MALFKWDAKYSVEIQDLDNHHKHLVSLINELYEAMQVGKGRDKMMGILKELIKYASYHFSAEEKLMEQYDYPDFKAHKEQHDSFKKKVADFEKDLEEGKIMLSVDILNFLMDWLLNHIRISDKKYSPYFRDKGLT